MATIFTVHGTNATGPEEGNAWWQRGSEFEKDVRRYVESEDGHLNFEPHIWDGRNSENSRRAAARGLFERLSKCVNNSQMCCAIGHSHGGSVIASALIQASIRKASLNGLSRWITIGTPFIALEKRGLMFSRLGAFGKTSYISLIVLSLWMFLILAVPFSRNFAHPTELPTIASNIIFLILLWLVFQIAFTPAVMGWLFMSLREKRTFRHFQAPLQTWAKDHFLHRWARCDIETTKRSRVCASCEMRPFLFSMKNLSQHRSR